MQMCAMENSSSGIVQWDGSAIVKEIREKSHPFSRNADLQPLMDKIGDASIVLLGAMSYGIHEHTTWRSVITRKLVREKGFSFIALEADWNDCYRINRYGKCYPRSGESSFDLLHTCKRWPSWQLANWEMVAVAEWLQRENEDRAKDKRIGLYGLDIYGLRDTLDTVAGYLQANDVAALPVAFSGFGSFETTGNGTGCMMGAGGPLVPNERREAIVKLLTDQLHKQIKYSHDPEYNFCGQLFSQAGYNADNYYKALLSGDVAAWNTREKHMVDTLEGLLRYHGKDAKVVVWAHNMHVADERSSAMGHRGLQGLRNLIQARMPERKVFSVGFGAYKGQVITANAWGGDMKKEQLALATTDSWEAYAHEASTANKLILTDELDINQPEAIAVKNRAIGTLYRADTERNQYITGMLPKMYDAFIFHENVHAAYPLHMPGKGAEIPDNYPFGV